MRDRVKADALRSGMIELERIVAIPPGAIAGYVTFGEDQNGEGDCFLSMPSDKWEAMGKPDALLISTRDAL